MTALRKLVVAHMKQFVRERAALFWTFAFPIFFILIFGAIFTGQEDATFTVGLVVEDDSQTGLALAAAFGEVRSFELETGDRDSELDALKSGNRRAVVIIPPGFGQVISQGNPGHIDVYYDPTQVTTMQVVVPIVYRVVDTFDRTMTATPPLVQVNEQTLQVRDLRAIDYLVPGILALALMQLGLFAAIPLVVDRQNRVLKRLGATPLRRSTLVASTVIFRLFIALIQGALIIAIARFVFGVPMLGNWFFLAGVVILGTLTFLSMGYLLSAFAKTEEAITPLIMAIQFPLMFLSGIFFPVDMMPDFMRPVMTVMPLTYLGDSLRQIMVSSSPLEPHAVNLAVLGGWFAVCLAGAVRFFRWE